jgi:hypothetical protein
MQRATACLFPLHPLEGMLCLSIDTRLNFLYILELTPN